MSSSSNPGDKPAPKIIVDDDWKTRVQAEKEAAVQQKSAAGPAVQPAAGPTPEPPPASPSAATDAETQIPPASFAVLVSMLATQALSCLGQLPLPGRQAPEVHLPEAKHFIDLLAVLEAKTKGNLSADEAAIIDNVLHELRMAYVAISRR